MTTGEGTTERAATGPITTSGPRSELDAGGRLTAAAIAGAGLTAITVAVTLAPSTLARGPELCPFARMTGLPCPACGFTRSWVAMGHGDVAGAFAVNAFGPVFMLVAVIATAVALWALLTGRPVTERLRRVMTSPVALAVLVVWFGYGIVRAVDAAAGWGVFPTII
ncbi:DUF2752 domain-containing protein [Gordonia insulae]|uniref:DUF2752 domain-containing protein n=1 Tax=Gordonia insulae TaxID=2420509 RepID=UPI001E5E06DD|nr:DUF2752 domain-containing protein [Gordonia insulae]